MKRLILLSLLAAGFASATVLAGRDQVQTMELQRAIEAKRRQADAATAHHTAPVAGSRAGDVRKNSEQLKEGEAGQEQLKRFHPKNAYGYD